MSFEQRLDKIVEKYHFLNEKLANVIDSTELVKLSKEHAEINAIATAVLEYKKKIAEKDDLKKIINDKDVDSDFRQMAFEESKKLENEIEEKYRELRIIMLPKDANDEKDVILEIRAGTGGEEAALFAAVLLRMYQRFAEKQRWKFEIISMTETGLDGCKEALISISGNGVFAKMKFESGGHRVQRVPETESSGRIHTSAATVAVLPSADEFDLHIEEKDLRIDVYRSSGAGGQHVNTTDSAVRVTHIPTNTVVCVQDGRSQHQNKAKAMQVLRSRIYEAETAKRDLERSEVRKQQVGSGDRSERIRTYNYPQGRITDHRINLTLYSLPQILAEGDLDELIAKLTAEDQAAKLGEIDG